MTYDPINKSFDNDSVIDVIKYSEMVTENYHQGKISKETCDWLINKAYARRYDLTKLYPKLF